jgi:hypothetical protein
MDHLMTDIGVVLAFMGLGWWLEGINGKHGMADELLTWLPMGIGGSGMMVLFERAWA